ncbi:Na+/H+ antiporter family protein [Suttonella ornithocola]|uniref:Na+/H+ antiporter family n=1 Tax=Suttonella ornithocola TaxID=279832 RepID=A0A380MQT0_9GAMM|nr:Na+/H+ antiporter family protein [Suttonella ornithocola]SUO94426.1 Na+/H+ antiporter family [Suttonella ornithocola]
MNDLLSNPVLIAVVLMLALSFMRVHVVLSLIISAMVGGLLADIPAQTLLDFAHSDATTPTLAMKLQYVSNTFESGIGKGAKVALSYAVLGAFAVAISYSGLAQALCRFLAGSVKEGPGQAGIRIKWSILLILLAMSMMSQNLIPIHIAFIPLIVPPLLMMMNRLEIDRRMIACVLTFGLVCTYMFLPYGFGAIYLNDILLTNIQEAGLETHNLSIYQAMGIPALGMFIGLCIAIFISYRKPRHYEDRPIEGGMPEQAQTKKRDRWIATATVVIAFLVQIYTDSLMLAALIGFTLFMATRVIHWSKADAIFNDGIRMMSMIGFIMIAANGFAEVMKMTGGIETLVNHSALAFGNSKGLAALTMLCVGLLITMGIGSSFSTLPIIIVIYVPLCQQLGFSPLATVAIIGTAGALGDAGSPASDSTLGPTMGLNADGQHDHIRDSVIPTFLHYNIPLIITGWIAAMAL